MSKVFISYRRAESEYVVGRIYEDLCRTYSENNIFKDVESIPLGVDFRDEISRIINSCDILLVIIGPDWLRIKDESGNLRIHQKDDYVRIEVEEALARNIPIIPIITRNAILPKESQLPRSLKALAYRTAISVRPDPDFKNDLKTLKKNISKTYKVKSKDHKENIAILSLAVCLFLIAYFLIKSHFDNTNRMKTQQDQSSIALKQTQERLARALIEVDRAKLREKLAQTQTEKMIASEELDIAQKKAHQAEIAKNLANERYRELEKNLLTTLIVDTGKPYKGEELSLVARLEADTENANLWDSPQAQGRNKIREINRKERFLTHMQSGKKYWRIKTANGEIGYLRNKLIYVEDQRKFYLKATVKTETKGSKVRVRDKCLNGKIVAKVSDKNIFYTYRQAKGKKCYAVKLPNNNKPLYIGYDFVKILP